MKNYWKLRKQLPNRKNEEVVSDFLLSLKLANRSEYTLIKYREVLEDFFGDKKDDYSILSSEEIFRWIQANKNHLKEKSLHIYLAIISSFYSFCVREGLIEHSLIKRRWFPSLPQSVPKFLGKGDIAKVRQASEQTSLRNQGLIELMLSSGCRLGEVHRLNIEDVELENRTARVLGKGKKIRHIHFSDKCAIILERYLIAREVKPTSPLFVAERKESRLSIARIKAIVDEIGKKAGLSTRLHPHRFRHTFATELLAKGAEISFISEELGHSNLSTTQIYARLTNQTIISQYRKFMG